ncbi:MCM2/3/5 family protein, partial [Toxoplasma gondii FOU]
EEIASQLQSLDLSDGSKKKRRTRGQTGKNATATGSVEKLAEVHDQAKRKDSIHQWIISALQRNEDGSGVEVSQLFTVVSEKAKAAGMKDFTEAEMRQELTELDSRDSAPLLDTEKQQTLLSAPFKWRERGGEDLRKLETSSMARAFTSVDWLLRTWSTVRLARSLDRVFPPPEEGSRHELKPLLLSAAVATSVARTQPFPANVELRPGATWASHADLQRLRWPSGVRFSVLEKAPESVETDTRALCAGRAMHGVARRQAQVLCEDFRRPGGIFLFLFLTFFFKRRSPSTWVGVQCPAENGEVEPTEFFGRRLLSHRLPGDRGLVDLVWSRRIEGTDATPCTQRLR